MTNSGNLASASVRDVHGGFCGAASCFGARASGDRVALSRCGEPPELIGERILPGIEFVDPFAKSFQALECVKLAGARLVFRLVADLTSAVVKKSRLGILELGTE